MNKRSIQPICLAAFVALALHLTAYSQALPPVQDTPDGPFYLPGEVLIKFVADVSDQQLDEVVRLAGVTSARHIHTAAMKARGDNGITQAFTTRPVAQAIQALQNHPAIEYAEPNWVYQHQATPNDPYFTGGQLWGMYGNLSSPDNAYGSQAAEAWAAAIGSKDVVVGVIDEGIQITHPDLAANIWINPGETAGDGKDNDGNGYVDDIYGWDFYENNNTVYDGTSDDHGTHVTGTIGAVGGNGVGVVGVNWAVSIIAGKFLGPNGGSTTDAIEAVDYFTDLKANGVNVVALNNSWGGGGYSQGLHDAIIRAAKAGILFVASSGNGNRVGKAVNTDSSPTYPACYNTAVGTSTETAAAYDAVISVTAIDSSGNKASFANYGATTVDLGAPGVSILSTLPIDTYGSYSGTSMAAPHVTGAIALYASTHPGAAAADIKTAILNSTASTPSLSGKTVTGGRLDLSTVVTDGMNLTLPDAPTGLEAEALNASQIRLTWIDRSDNETRFEITRTRTLGTENTTFTAGPNVTSYTDSGLSESTTYSYSIRACNSVGCSEEPVATAVATTQAWEPATASFVKMDTATQGDWIGNYGSEGYDIVLYKNAPAYGTITVFGDYNPPTVWASSTSEARALSTPSDSLSRFAACYFQLPSQSKEFYIDVNLASDTAHRVTLYCLDWDRLGRKETIEIVDPIANKTLHTYNLDSFGDGKYLTWEVRGHVLIKVIWIDSPTSTIDNPVVSGIFLDPVPDAFPTATTMHCGDLDGIATSSGANWRATVTVTIRDASDNPVSGATVFGTWSGGTSGTASGPTIADGTVSFTTASLSKKIGSVTFTITDVTGANLTYDPSANHDPDTDSNGTSITVNKP
jgi:subtilisin family serine protease